MVADVQEMKEDAVGLLSFFYSSAAVATAMVLAPSAAHHAVIQDVVPLSGFYLSFAAVAATAFSKIRPVPPAGTAISLSQALQAAGIQFYSTRPLAGAFYWNGKQRGQPP